MSSPMNTSTLPAAMEKKLRSIRRRQAMLTVLKAGAIGASVLIAAMLMAMIADWWLTLFDTGIRAALTTGSVVLAVAALLLIGTTPLIAAFRWTRAATGADEEVPQLQQRWTTVATMATSAHQPTTDAAKAMLQQVTSEAVAMERLVQPAQVARPTMLRPAMLTLAGSLLVLAGFLAIDWPQTSVLLRRFWSPTANITATQLRSVTGDATVPRGELLDLVTELSGLPRQTAILELAAGSEIRDAFELTPDEERGGKFVHRLRVDGSIRYRIRSGDGQTPWHTVTAIDYPALGEVRFTVTAPDYADRPKYEKTLIPRRVRVIEGSRLELSMRPIEALERLDLSLSSEGESKDAEEAPARKLLALTPDADGWYHFQTQLLEDISLNVALLNEHGLRGEDSHACRIQVIPDKAPVARIISPTDEMAVAVDDKIDIKFEAHDDHGIATAELVVYDETAEGQEPKILSVQPIPLGDQHLQKHVMSSTQLDLRELNLKEGTQISYAVRVTDNRMVQFDPDARRAQTAEAKPGASEDQPQLADAGKPGDAKSSQEDGQRSRSPVDNLANMLTDTRDPSGNPPTVANRSDEHNAPDESQGEADRKPSVSSPGADNDGKQEATSSPTAPSSESGNKPSDRPAKRNGDLSEPTNPNKAGGRDADSNGKPTDQESSKNGGKSGVPAKSATPGEGDPKPSRDGNDTQDGKPTESKSTDSEPADSVPADSVPAGGKPTDGKPQDKSAIASDGGERRGDAASPESDPPMPGDSQPKETPDNAKTADSGTQTPAGASSERPNDKTNGDEKRPNSPDTARETNLAGSNSTNRTDRDEKRGGGKSKPSESPPPERNMAMNGQQSESGQNTETRRRKLKITQRLTAVAASRERKAVKMKIRDRVVRIDEMLAEVEDALTRVVQREIPDADRSEQFRRIDAQLGDVDSYIAELREETKDGQFAFVGLQMVDIGRTHVTPARDRAFIAIREPLGSDNPTIALQEVVRARELLAALLKRYDRVARDQELAKALEESVKMYEIYIERTQQLLREARQNRNPLTRKMEIIEVDQDYLDRYAEVLTLRREMMAEFARILGDDPRLLARYLDLTKRRRSSLRDQLSELLERQDEIAVELSGWLQVGEAQRDGLWMLIAELRLHAATPLAKDAAELAERIEKQMPLVLESDQGTPALVMQHARRIAQVARGITFDAKQLIRQGGQADDSLNLLAAAEQLVLQFSELDAALDQLNFEHEDQEEVTTYVSGRLLDSRAVADQADAWAQVAGHLQQRRYHGLAEIDQHKVAIATELLRIDMLGFEDDLQGQFQRQLETGVPGEIIDLVRELHRVMEAITFNQAAATFAMTQARLDTAEVQQAKALAGFELAEELFDKIRRAVIAALDEYDPPDPNIADLEDPTLDRFLTQLEREPNIQAQLGIPNRPRNLRVLADTMQWQQQGGDMLGDAGQAAKQRAREQMRMRKQRNQQPNKPAKPDNELTDEEREQLASARQMEEMLEKSLATIQEKIDDPETSPQQRRRLEQMAKNMRRMLDQAGQPQASSEEWEKLVESDRAKEVLRALAAGEAIPDDQWIKLLSTLDEGLWQVGGRTPPEDYRKAIEQYQDRIRLLLGSTGGGEE